MLRLRMIPTLDQCLELNGGATQTIFPKTEKKLGEGDYIKALKYVASRKNMNRYKSVMDFLFCEMFPTPWKFKAFRFYNDQGPQLKDDPEMSDALIKMFDSILCNVVLEICKDALNKDRRKEWGWSNKRRVTWEQMRTVSLQQAA